MNVPTTVELPAELLDRLRQRAEATGVALGSLIVRTLEERYAEETDRVKKGNPVTGPLIPATGRRGPLYPVDENPHDLVFS
jgi:hypothetical protein